MEFIKFFADFDKNQLPLVGGKAFNLGLMKKSGFSVPDGFCITTKAYHNIVKTIQIKQNINLPDKFKKEIQIAYNKIGAGKVAVRSSATAEDLPNASFAGQQETFLNVQGVSNLLDAVKKCWASLWTQRAVAYRKDHDINEDALAMAVVVQKMVNSNVSGVMFTVNPTGNENEIVIESSWGLGEAVVSGQVNPDRFIIDKKSLNITESSISNKKIMFNHQGKIDVPEDKQEIPSLDEGMIQELAEQAIDIEQFYNSPQDIEWAFDNDRLYILQARPITTRIKKDEQSLIAQEIERLKNQIEPEGTIWSQFNLSEILPKPLPMTYHIVRKFMSGKGGFGKTYRDLGFNPAPIIDQEGVLNLFCGRLYFNLNREAKLYFNGFPFEHNFEFLKSHPEKASYPKATVNIKKASMNFWFKLPMFIYKMSAAERKLKNMRKNYDQLLKEKIIPDFEDFISSEKEIELSKLSDKEVLDKFYFWIEATLTDFASDALKATVFAQFSYGQLESAIEKQLGEAGKELSRSLVVGLENDLTVESNLKMWEIALEKISLEQFLDKYGHRAVNEFELAQPRWREDPSFVEKMVDSFKQNPDMNPAKRLENQRNLRLEAEETLHKNIKSVWLQKTIDKELKFTRKYMPFRENAKFYLMLGYELIRNALLELDRRFKLNNGIFFLTLDELPDLLNGTDFQETILERKQRREQLLKIDLPKVLFSDELDKIEQKSRLTQIMEGESLRGTPVSIGTAEGKALVILEPEQASSIGKDYILVCPSTDPGWTPLFMNASGLVMERGGMLSHGAVVAREYGIPAVVNVHDATNLIQNGQKLMVDGNEGIVCLL